MQKETEDLQTRLQRVKRDRKRKSLSNKMKANAWKTSIAKECLEDHNILLSYVTDKFGFRKGVVIAIGAGQLGWSLVAKEDYSYKDLGIEQVPILARFIQNPNGPYQEEGEDIGAAAALAFLVNAPAFKAWASQGNRVMVPNFDRKMGITAAMDRARLYASIQADKGYSFEDVDIPNDADLREALAHMNIRSHRYYQQDVNAMVEKP